MHSNLHFLAKTKFLAKKSREINLRFWQWWSGRAVGCRQINPPGKSMYIYRSSGDYVNYGLYKMDIQSHFHLSLR
jgi:hypothetical protein